MKTIILATVAALISASTAAQSPTNAALLAKELDGYREACTTMASKYASADSLAIYKDGLDRDLAQTQIEVDTRVYAVSNGGRASTEYMLSRMRQQIQQDKEKTNQRADERKAHGDEVSACVTNALEQGKSLYAGFKKGKRAKPAADEASDVMTAWVVNTQSISLATPKGSEESNAEWEKAKAHAELESL